MAKTAAAEKLKDIAANTEQGLDRTQMLPPRRLAEPDFGWRSFEATLPADTPRAHILCGAFWRLCAARLRRGDHIRWRDDPLVRFGELVVVATDAATGKLELRELWSREIAGVQIPHGEKTGFTPKDFGVFEKWGIVRDADGQVLCQNIESYDEAMRRIRTEYIPNTVGGVARNDFGGGTGGRRAP